MRQNWEVLENYAVCVYLDGTPGFVQQRNRKKDGAQGFVQPEGGSTTATGTRDLARDPVIYSIQYMQLSSSLTVVLVSLPLDLRLAPREEADRPALRPLSPSHLPPLLERHTHGHTQTDTQRERLWTT